MKRLLEHLRTLRRSRDLRDLTYIAPLREIITGLRPWEDPAGGGWLEYYHQVVENLIVQLGPTESSESFHILDPQGAILLQFFKYLSHQQVFTERIGATSGHFTGEVLAAQSQKFCDIENKEVDPQVLAECAKATPLLKEIGFGSYTFIHRIILEYLSACFLSEQEDCKSVFCRALFDQYLSETEVLPMTLGLVAEPDDFYAILEQLPESLTLTNLRVRARSLAYAQGISDQHLTTLIDHLIETIDGRTGEEKVYRDLIVLSFSLATGPPLEAIVERVVDLMRSGKPFTTWFAASALGELGGERAMHALLRELDGEDNGLRMNAAFALGRIGDERAVDGLLKALKAEEATAIRWAAAQALGNIGSTRAVGGLLEAIRDKESIVRWDAADALSNIGDNEVIGALSALLEYEDNNARLAAAFVLAMAGDERAKDVLLSGLNEKEIDNDLRSHLVSALGDVGGVKVISALLDALKKKIDEGSSEEINVRRSAAEALGQIGKKHPQDNSVKGPIVRQRVIAALLEALEVEDNDVRWRAAWELGKIGDQRAVDGLIEALRDDRYSGARWRAAEALGKIGGERAVQALFNTLEDEDNFVRRSAALALGQAGNPEVFAECLEALKDRDTLVRWRAAEALGRIGDARAVGPLLDALQDDLEVRDPAANSLAEMSYPDIARGLIEALSYENSFVRRLAAQVIGYYSSIGDVVEQLSRLSTKDPSYEVRASASEALEKVRWKLECLGSG